MSLYFLVKCDGPGSAAAARQMESELRSTLEYDRGSDGVVVLRLRDFEKALIDIQRSCADDTPLIETVAAVNNITTCIAREMGVELPENDGEGEADLTRFTLQQRRRRR